MAQKMNFTNNQKALEYAIYMMVGSYFKKAVCLNKAYEETLRVHYCEQKLDNQYHMEDQCIKYVESVLMEELPEDIWQEEVEARILVLPNAPSEIRFTSPKYMLRLLGSFDGKKVKIEHLLLKKRLPQR